ncbi:MAG: transposase [Gammaproteobacteria bacterium]|nr:transposase [Gammaproteobacteria bacterium]
MAEQRLTGVVRRARWCTCSKTPYRDGTTHVAFEPLDFIARLAAVVPRPRVNLTRYHGVLAANHRWRAEVTPSGRGRRRERNRITRAPCHRAARAAMIWAQRLKRVFGIDVESCVRCGQAVKIITPASRKPALIETDPRA